MCSCKIFYDFLRLTLKVQYHFMPVSNAKKGQNKKISLHSDSDRNIVMTLPTQSARNRATNNSFKNFF